MTAAKDVASDAWQSHIVHTLNGRLQASGAMSRRPATAAMPPAAFRWQVQADSVEKLVDNNGLRVRLGTAARAFTISKYSVLRLVRDHEELYNRLLSNQAKS